MSFDSFKVGRGETKTRAKAPPIAPPPFLQGVREKSGFLAALQWLGFGSLSVQSGLGGGEAEGGQAGSANAYHDHNRAKEHSSAMKAQRERLRIPGLTLE